MIEGSTREQQGITTSRTWIKLQVIESKSLGQNDQVNLYNLISHSGFRLVSLRPCDFLSSQVCGGFPCKYLEPYCLYLLYLIFYLNCLEQVKLIIPNILQGFHKRCISIYSYLIDLFRLLLKLLGWLSWWLWLLSMTNYCYP